MIEKPDPSSCDCAPFPVIWYPAEWVTDGRLDYHELQALKAQAPERFENYLLVPCPGIDGTVYERHHQPTCISRKAEHDRETTEVDS